MRDVRSNNNKNEMINGKVKWENQSTKNQSTTIINHKQKSYKKKKRTTIKGEQQTCLTQNRIISHHSLYLSKYYLVLYLDG